MPFHVMENPADVFSLISDAHGKVENREVQISAVLSEVDKWEHIGMLQKHMDAAASSADQGDMDL